MRPCNNGWQSLKHFLGSQKHLNFIVTLVILSCKWLTGRVLAIVFFFFLNFIMTDKKNFIIPKFLIPSSTTLSFYPPYYRNVFTSIKVRRIPIIKYTAEYLVRGGISPLMNLGHVLND